MRARRLSMCQETPKRSGCAAKSLVAFEMSVNIALSYTSRPSLLLTSSQCSISRMSLVDRIRHIVQPCCWPRFTLLGRGNIDWLESAKYSRPTSSMLGVLLYQEGSRPYAKPPTLDWSIMTDIMNDVKNGIVYQESIDCIVRILDEALSILRPYKLIAEWLAETLLLKVGLNIVLRLLLSISIGGQQMLQKVLSWTWFFSEDIWKRSC